MFVLVRYAKAPHRCAESTHARGCEMKYGFALLKYSGVNCAVVYFEERCTMVGRVVYVDSYY